MKLSIPALLALVLLITGCKKDMTDETDITNHVWKLTSVETSGETIIPDSVHILEFPNDSLFYFNLSVNTGGGYYNIPSPGNINIKSFGPFTEICCDDTDVDYALFDAMPAVTSYRVLDDILILEGNAGEIEFIADH